MPVSEKKIFLYVRRAAGNGGSLPDQQGWADDGSGVVAGELTNKVRGRRFSCADALSQTFLRDRTKETS